MYTWVQHTQNFVEKTFACGSQTVKFVKVFSLEVSRYMVRVNSITISMHKPTDTQLYPNGVYMYICNVHVQINGEQCVRTLL